jgi:multiple sugar transport system permease protein
MASVSARTERGLWVVGTTAPALLFLLVIAYLPILYAVSLSFFKKTAFNPTMTWVGLGNYRFILEEPELWQSFWRSVVFTVGAVGLQLVWGLVSALLLNQAFRGLNLVRSLFVLPYLLPSIVVALVFQWLLSQEYGVVNQILVDAGAVSRPVNFFGGLGTAMWAVIGMAGWQYGSFATLLILARLQAINPKLYEAARVSGAGPVRCFLDVTLPNLRTTLVVIALLRGIWMFNKFDSIWLVTHGGPLKATETLPLYAYRLAFEEFDFGLAAAACSVMFVVLVIGAFLYFKLFDPTREIEVGR